MSHQPSNEGYLVVYVLLMILAAVAGYVLFGGVL